MNEFDEIAHLRRALSAIRSLALATITGEHTESEINILIMIVDAASAALKIETRQ